MHSFKNPYFGFIDGHNNFDENDLDQIFKLKKIDDDDINIEFENRFSNIIGPGSCVSFASARMGFFAILKSLNIGSNDEVIIQGATCAVMINAIIRIGAKPVYSDVDPKTFGSSAKEISKLISSKTKVIVAQHSFGIPCDIVEIKKLAKSKGVFLVEDCALTLSSKIDQIVCGNFGDAAIFSTDHSKPINLLIGGLVYTHEKKLFDKLVLIKDNSKNLSEKKKTAIWEQILFERKYFLPNMYGRSLLRSSIKKRTKNYINPFLDSDSSSFIQSNYPYPAKMPSFLAFLGIMQLDKWETTAKYRCTLLSDFLDLFPDKNDKYFSIYYDKNRNIVPLRLAWAPINGDRIRKKFGSFIDISWTWFLNPIVATNEKMINFGYKKNSCPISEKISKNIINLPCNIPYEWTGTFMKKLKKNIMLFYN